MSRTGKVSPSSMEQNGTPRVCCGYIRERTQARNGQQANEEDKKQTLTTVVFRLPKSASAAKAHPTAAVTWQSVPNSLCGDCKQETNPENSSTAEEVLDLESLQVWKEQSTENKAETSDKQDKQTKVGSKKGPSKRSQESRGTAAQQDKAGHRRIQQDTKAKDGGGQGTQLKDDKPSPVQATTDKSHGKFETHEKNGSTKQPGCIRCLLTESPTSQTSTTPSTSKGRKQPLLILYLLGETTDFCDGNRQKIKAFERNFMSCLLDTNTWIFANSGLKDYLISIRENNSFRDDKNVFFFYTDPAEVNNETIFFELSQFSEKKRADLVFVFLNGKKETFMATVPVALNRSIPVIVIQGSGNFADIVSQIRQSKKPQETRVDTRGKNQKVQSNMKDSSLKQDKKQSRTKNQHERTSVLNKQALGITKSQSPPTTVKEEKNYRQNSTVDEKILDWSIANENFTVFDLVSNLGSKSALRLCVLEAIIKKDNTNHSEEQDKHLKLALAWEFPEKAEEMKRSKFKKETLSDLMKKALQGGQAQFVSIFLDLGARLENILKDDTPAERGARLTEVSKTFDDRSSKHLEEAPKTFYEKLSELTQEDPQTFYKKLSKLIQENQKNMKLDDILQHLLDDICIDEPDKVKQNSSTDSGQSVKDPELALFLWALLSGKFGLAQFLWREVQDHVTTALVACILLRAMRSRTMNSMDFEDEQQEILENIEIFEGLAIKALNNCYRQDEIKTFTLLSRIQKTEYWSNVTCLEIAERARCRKFIAQEPCQNFADTIWRGLDPFSKKSEKLQVDRRVIFTRIFYAICAIFVVVPKVFMEFSKNKRGPSQLAYAFRHFCFYWPRHWEDPSFKFYSGWFFFMGFLVLYAYVMMVRIPPEDVQIPELALLVWFITLYIEELRVCWSLSKSKRKEKRVFVLSQLGFLNVTNFYLAMIGIVLWIIDSKLLALHFVICLNFISFVFRLFYYLAINSQLGPKVFMIYQMIKEIILFSVILMIIFIAYGVVKYSLENRGHGVVNSAVVLSLPVEAFWLMLADRPDDKDDSNQDPVVVFRGLLRVVYLMFTGVLLVNLLIAAFSYLFEVIHSQKEDVRKYQKYQMIVQFYLGSPLPPPLSLFYYIITYLYRFIHCCYRKQDDKSYEENKFRKSLNEKETRSLLNWARVTTESYNDDKPKTIEERVEETMKKNFELHDDNNDDSLKKLVDAAQGLIDESHKLHESLQCSTDALRDALEELAGWCNAHRELSPETTSSFFNRMIFFWFTRMIVIGYKRGIEMTDVWDLNPRDTSRVLMARFNQLWQQEVRRFHRFSLNFVPVKYISNNKKRPSKTTSSTKETLKAEICESLPLLGNKISEKMQNNGSLTSVTSASESCLTDSKPALNQSVVQGTQYQTLVQNPVSPSGKLDSGLEESIKDKVSFRQNESQQTKDHTTRDAPSLTKVLVKQFAGQMTVLLIQRLLSDAFFIVTTLVFGELITHLNNRRPGQEWQGYVLALTLFVCGLLRAVFYACSNYRAYYTGLQIKSVVIGAVYCKALRINNATRKTATIGEVVNLMAVDAQRLQEFISRLFFGMTIPFLLVAVVALMYIRVGVSAFAGIVLLLLLVPLNGLVGVLQKRFQIRNLTNKDKRVKLINEILNGIKVVKLYAWEPSLERRVNDVRDREISSLLKVALLHMVLGLCWSIVPFLVTLATYGTFVLVENDNFLTTSDAFVIMSLFQILAPPLDYLSLLISFTVQAKVSVGRINKFLCSEERDNTMVTQESHSNNAICIEDASLTWDDMAKPTLEDINLKIPEGRLVAVVGQAGAGKSSLINAILGEMTKTRGHIAVKGAIAYVPQQAWIQNATVRDNVLFGKAYQAERYKTVIRACQLERDLSILPAGDLTEIGEKGTNLSGGQKQRVSLARAVYSDRDVYLLDDPLSAVDSHVGKALFRDVIGPQGLLKGKTRVLVTHGVHWLPLVEEVVVLRGGRIVETGSYSELMLYNGHLAQFLRSCLLDFNQPLQVYRADHQEEVENESSTDEEVMTMEKKIFEDVTSDAYSSGNETYEHFRKRKRKDKLERRRLSQAPMLSSVKESSQVGEDDVDEEAGKLVMTEKLLKGRVSTSVYLAHPKAGGLFTVLLGIASFFAFQATSVVANFWLRDWTEDPLLNNQSSWGSEEFVQRNYFYLLCYGMFGIAQVFFLIVFNYLHWTRAVRASKRLHERLINRLLQAPMAFFDTTPLGRIMNRVSSDMEIVDNIVPVVIRDNLFTFGVLVATLVVISIISPFIIIFLVLLAIFIYFAFLKAYIPTSRQCRRMESVTRSPIFAHLSETMSGVATIRAYKATDRFIGISESRVDTNQTYFYGYIAGLRWCQMLMDTLTFIMVFLAAVLEVVASDSSGGSVGLSVSYALQLSYRMTSLARLATDFETNVVSVERVKEYSEVETEAPWFVDTYRPDLNWPSRGEVELKDLTVRYRPKLPLVLKGLNCVLRGGEKIGVVGRTGAGKSSLSLALFRLVEPAGGTIVIDGVNIALVGLHQLRTRITILPQDPVLFSGTLRFNLDPTGGRSDEALWKALKQAHLQHLVQSLPGGLDFNCGDEGANLSVGQRQLVCLARTLLKKTHLLVLDEATAAVDMETDALIQKTVREAFSDCTVITIAHRLHTVMDYDRIMVLDSGRIVEFDTPQRLMSSPHSAFANMIKDAEMTGKL